MRKLVPTTIGDRAREHQRNFDDCAFRRRGCFIAFGGWRRRRDRGRTRADQQRGDQDECTKYPTTFV